MEPNKKSLYLAILWTVVVTVLSLVSIENNTIGSSIPYKDKIAHFVFYFVFMLTWGLYFLSFRWNTSKVLWSVFLFAIVFGILMEVCQELFTTTRKAEVADAIANTIGSTIGLLVLHLLTRNQK